MGTLENERIVDPVLSNLALGFKMPELIGTVLAPVVEVEKEAGKIPQFSDEEFKEFNTERAIRAASNVISPEGMTTIDYALKEHDIAYPIDYREQSESMFNKEKRGALVTQRIILQRLEREIASLVQNNANYDSDHKIGLSTTACWSEKDTSTPIDDIDNGKEAIRASIGVYPNVMVLGAAAFRALRNHPQIIEKIKYSVKAVITKEMLQDILEIETIVVGKAITKSDAGVRSDIWGDNAILAYVAPPPPDGIERDEYDPSFAYTLRKKGMPQIDKFNRDGKVLYVRNTDLLTVKMVGPTAGYLIENVVK